MNSTSSNTFIVYKHTSPSNKVYIGITEFNPHFRRKNNGSGYKHQSVFFNAIIKYGWINFKHEIVAEHLTKQEALDKEEELIQLYKSYDRRYGYNISLRGPKYGDTIKERKIKSRRLPVAELPKWKNCGKIVHKKTKDGTIVKTYRSVHELAIELDTPIETLRTRLNKYKVLKFDTFNYMYADNQTPKVEMLSMEDEYIRTFDSLAEAYKYLNRVNKGGITEVCTGKKISYNGYKWRFKYEN